MEDDIKILGYLSIIKDPRLDHKKLHDLGDILFIGICATLCGCDTWEDIHLFAEERKDWLQQYIDLKNDIPSVDTIARVFWLIKNLKRLNKTEMQGATRISHLAY